MMPTIKKIFAVAILMCSFTQPVFAGIPIVWGTPEKIAKVADFPDTDAFKMDDGSYLDAGVKYKVFELFWVPLYDYDHNWAGYVGTDDTYMSVSHDKLVELAQSAGVTLPDQPVIPFWDAWGGKLVAAGLVLAFILYIFVFGRDEENQQETES